MIEPQAWDNNMLETLMEDVRRSHTLCSHMSQICINIMQQLVYFSFIESFNIFQWFRVISFSGFQKNAPKNTHLKSSQEGWTACIVESSCGGKHAQGWLRLLKSSDHQPGTVKSIQDDATVLAEDTDKHWHPHVSTKNSVWWCLMSSFRSQVGWSYFEKLYPKMFIDDLALPPWRGHATDLDRIHGCFRGQTWGEMSNQELLRVLSHISFGPLSLYTYVYVYIRTCFVYEIYDNYNMYVFIMSI